MNGRKTDPQKAAAVVAMSEGGYGPSAISRDLEIPRSTVRSILNGDDGWNRIHDQVWFRQYVATQRVALQASLTEIAKKGLKRVDDTIDKASTGQAMWVTAVAIDKARLLGGEATEIHEVITRKKWDNLNDEMVMIHAEMGRRIAAAKVIEVESESESEGVTIALGQPRT